MGTLSGLSLVPPPSGMALAFLENDLDGTGRVLAETARRLGLWPVLLTVDPRRYPADLDCFGQVALLPAGTRDAVSSWCRDFTGRGGRLAGVLSASEYHVGTAAQAARTVGLPHAEPEAVARCRNRADARAYLSAAGVPVPGWALCRTQADVARAAGRLGPVVVVKPVDGAGIWVARTTRQAHEAAAPLLSSERRPNRLPGVVVESYVEGPELSVEVWNGRAVTAIRDHTGPDFVPLGHDVPAPLESVDIAWVCQAAEEAAVALGMRWGPVHVELRLAADVPRITQVDPRLAPGDIPNLVRLATGIDLAALHVAQSAGLPVPDVRYGQARAAAIRYQDGADPVLVVADDPEDAAALAESRLRPPPLRAAA
jgi:argininosuccinate lyase